MTPCFSKSKMPLIARHAIIYVPSRKNPHCHQAVERRSLKYALRCLRISVGCILAAILPFFHRVWQQDFTRVVQFSGFLYPAHWQPSAPSSLKPFFPLPAGRCILLILSALWLLYSFFISLAGSSLIQHLSSGEPQGSGHATLFYLHSPSLDDPWL